MDWDEAMIEAREEMGYSEGEYISDWDELIETAHYIQDDAKEEMQDEYQEYLKTPHWKKTREVVLIRDNNKCNDCGNTAQEVHHESYDNVYIDSMYETRDYVDEGEVSDCVSLCVSCHRGRHC